MPRMTSKGQVTIPKEIRLKLGVGPGGELSFEWDGEGVRVRTVKRSKTLRRWKGSLKFGKGVDLFVDDLRGKA
jgi:AbrB family looped-hinge helix DNA binding protein